VAVGDTKKTRGRVDFFLHNVSGGVIVLLMNTTINGTRTMIRALERDLLELEKRADKLPTKANWGRVLAVRAELSRVMAGGR